MTDPEKGSITIIGLGPGDVTLITRRAWQLIEASKVLLLRTERHPLVADLPVDVRWESFDHVYDEASSFVEVYEQIAVAVLARGRNEHVVYAVPGDPSVGEATVTAIIEGAAQDGIAVSVVPGVSFVEPTLAALGIDALSGLQLFDGIALAGYNYPPLNPDVPLLLAQVYSRLLANELKLTLMSVYPEDHAVALVHGAGTGEVAVEGLPLFEIDRSNRIGHLTSLYVPPLRASGSLAALAEAVAVLRGPDGCPWDREQTPQSLRSGLLEEVSEVLDALDNDDVAALREELGDVLLHIVMQTQMAWEDEQFRLADVIAEIYAKIKRRHPHVWGDWNAEGAEEVVAKWEAIKANEKDLGGAVPSLMTNIPRSLPALARAQKIQGRAKKVGFDWPAEDGVAAKVQEEIAELREATDPEAVAAELGDLLFSVVNWARWRGVDAETALREANLRFLRRFQAMEVLARQRKIDLEEADLVALESLWQEAKGKPGQEREAEWSG